MRLATLLIPLLMGSSLLAAAACGGDAARAPFEAAAEEDRRQNADKAVELYVQAHEAAPESRYGKMALARAEVLLLEMGAQQLDADQWDGLDQTAARLMALDETSGPGALYKGYAAYGKGRPAEAIDLLRKAGGELRGVTPPTDLAVEATAQALFNGSSAGARSALGGSSVDGDFLASKRDRLAKRIENEQKVAARRAELLAEGTLDSMANLLGNYPESEEATKVRGTYAEQLAAKLASAERVGPPTVDDPDPIGLVVDSLQRYAPEEPATKRAAASAEKIRPDWEARYGREIERVNAEVEERQQRAMGQLAVIFREKCAPLRTRLQKGDSSAAEPLKAAAQEAAGVIPNGMTEEDLREIQLLIIGNCTVRED